MCVVLLQFERVDRQAAVLAGALHMGLFIDPTKLCIYHSFFSLFFFYSSYWSVVFNIICRMFGCRFLLYSCSRYLGILLFFFYVLGNRKY
jgi:hypothetical protein